MTNLRSMDVTSTVDVMRIMRIGARRYTRRKSCESTLGISRGRSLTRPFHDARQFPGIVARTHMYTYAANFWLCPSFKDHFLSPRAGDLRRYDSRFFLHRCMRPPCGPSAALQCGTRANAAPRGHPFRPQHPCHGRDERARALQPQPPGAHGVHRDDRKGHEIAQQAQSGECSHSIRLSSR